MPVETREAIRRAFMRAYATERLDRITIKGLCAQVPVARTTFYAHYANIDDVLEEVEDDLICGLTDICERVSQGDLSHMDFYPFLDETLAFIQGRWPDFTALVINQPDLRFIAKWKRAIKANFARRYPELKALPNFDLAAEMAASAAIGAYTYWLEHPEDAQIEDAKRLVIHALEGVVSAIEGKVRTLLPSV